MNIEPNLDEIESLGQQKEKANNNCVDIFIRISL